MEGPVLVGVPVDYRDSVVQVDVQPSLSSGC
jgi:hypothetical protein